MSTGRVICPLSSHQRDWWHLNFPSCEMNFLSTMYFFNLFKGISKNLSTNQCNQVGGITLHAYLEWTFECVSSAHYSHLFLICQLYFYYTANCISVILPTAFLLYCQLYFFYPANSISVTLPTRFILFCQLYFSSFVKCISSSHSLHGIIISAIRTRLNATGFIG